MATFNPGLDFARGLGFGERVQNARLAREERAFDLQQKREQAVRDDLQRRGEEAAAAVAPYLLDERGQFSLRELNRHMAEQPELRDSVRNLIAVSSGRDPVEVDLAGFVDNPQDSGSLVPVQRNANGELEPVASGEGGPDDVILTIDKKNVPGYVSAALYRFAPDAFNKLIAQRRARAQNQTLARVTDEALALRQQDGGGLEIVSGAPQAPAGGTQPQPQPQSRPQPSPGSAGLGAAGSPSPSLRPAQPPRLEVPPERQAEIDQALGLGPPPTRAEIDQATGRGPPPSREQIDEALGLGTPPTRAEIAAATGRGPPPSRQEIDRLTGVSSQARMTREPVEGSPGPIRTDPIEVRPDVPPPPESKVAEPPKERPTQRDVNRSRARSRVIARERPDDSAFVEAIHDAVAQGAMSVGDAMTLYDDVRGGKVANVSDNGEFTIFTNDRGEVLKAIRNQLSPAQRATLQARAAEDSQVDAKKLQQIGDRVAELAAFNFNPKDETERKNYTGEVRARMGRTLQIMRSHGRRPLSAGELDEFTSKLAGAEAIQKAVEDNQESVIFGIGGDDTQFSTQLFGITAQNVSGVSPRDAGQAQAFYVDRWQPAAQMLANSGNRPSEDLISRVVAEAVKRSRMQGISYEEALLQIQEGLL